MARLAVALLLLCCLAATAFGALYDKKRGFQTYKVPQERVDDFLKKHSPEAEHARYKNREEMEEHPTVQRFKKWRQMRDENHPDAGAAFAGKIPHDVIPHLHKIGKQNKPRGDDNMAEL